MTEMRIERGFYCTYDPFSRLDLRCELCIPGGVVCGALDSEGAARPAGGLGHITSYWGEGGRRRAVAPS
jgi:hypothetical protein